MIDVKTMPLSNNTVSSRADEMSEGIETQVVEKLKSIQMVDSHVSHSYC